MLRKKLFFTLFISKKIGLYHNSKKNVLFKSWGFKNHFFWFLVSEPFSFRKKSLCLFLIFFGLQKTKPKLFSRKLADDLKKFKKKNHIFEKRPEFIIQYSILFFVQTNQCEKHTNKNQQIVTLYSLHTHTYREIVCEFFLLKKHHFQHNIFDVHEYHSCLNDDMQNLFGGFFVFLKKQHM